MFCKGLNGAKTKWSSGIVVSRCESWYTTSEVMVRLVKGPGRTRQESW